MKFFLINLENSQKIELTHGQTLGRSKKADITLSDENVSSKHLGIKIDEQRIYIKDLDTSNGTILNGEKIKSNEFVSFLTDDELKLGHLRFKLESEQGEQLQGKKIVREFEFDFDSPEMDLGKDKIEDIVKVVKDGLSVEDKYENQQEAIRLINQDIKLYQEKEAQKERYKLELENINSENEQLLENEYSLKEIGKKYGDEWNEINRIIKELSSELSIMKEKYEKLAPQMTQFEKLIEIKETKTDLVAKVKSLTRKNFPQKIKDKKEELKEAKEQLKLLGKELRVYKEQQEKEKDLQRDQIKEEIKKLEDKLKKV